MEFLDISQESPYLLQTLQLTTNFILYQNNMNCSDKIKFHKFMNVRIHMQLHFQYLLHKLFDLKKKKDVNMFSLCLINLEICVHVKKNVHLKLIFQHLVFIYFRFMPFNFIILHVDKISITYYRNKVLKMIFAEFLVFTSF